jgi:Fur family transcriptional regulator, ferric uptake regulator
VAIEPKRKTKQRDAVRDVFEHSEHPLGIADVLEEASARVDGLGVATVYRAVAALVEEGWLETVELPGEPARYERADKGHHHHFQCETCDRVYDIKGCMDNLRQIVPPKFRIKAHSVMLYGVCADCSR